MDQRDVQAADPSPSTLGTRLMGALGTLIIVAVSALVLAFAIPSLCGYRPYAVADDAMAPSVPAASVVYVRAATPEEVQVDELVVYLDAADAVVRRVMANRTDTEELVLQADAAASDWVAEAHDATGATTTTTTITYGQLIGTVFITMPRIAPAATLYASTVGKVYLALALACGVMLNILADRRRDPRTRSAWVLNALSLVFFLIFAGSMVVVFYVRSTYRASDATYSTAAQSYTAPLAESTTSASSEPPIEVDFDALRATNPDVVGWIYCADTPIDYPVLQGATNNDYLRHDYTGAYNISGSIFVDADNRPGFVDAHNIVYGHHMSSGSMFAVLENWQDQDFYEAHPTMWLLTPTQDYEVVLVSGRHVSMYDDAYTVRTEHDEAWAAFLAQAVAESDFTPLPGTSAEPDATYVMLTTCSYIYDGARYVIEGKLVPR